MSLKRIYKMMFRCNLSATQFHFLCVLIQQSVISTHMSNKVHMEGNVNGQSSTIERDGEGKPYEGDKMRNLNVTKGGPLPFAYDILTAAHLYGNRVFTKYADEIPDYFKQCLPGGMTWERSMMFEDGGVCTINCDIRLKENCFFQKIQLYGVNLPSDGPAMKKETQGWEPSTEKMYGRDGVLKGDVTMVLKLERSITCVTGKLLTKRTTVAFRHQGIILSTIALR